MERQLAALTGRLVILSASVDPAVQGGAVVWIGDRVIDGSVAGYLASMERRLAEPAR
jgi:F-type H+-transporting ATPase subunit delta